MSSRILFFGTSEFACPALEALIKTGHQISAVITMPDKPAGRKQILTPPPVKVIAEKYGIPVLQPEKLDGFVPLLTKEGLGEVYDLFIVAAYGKIIPKEIIDLPKFGTLNIHPSLLPRWRGPSPVQYTILNGDTDTGVCVMKIDELVDHGPILAYHKSQVADGVTYGALHDELAQEGAQLLIKTLPKYLSGELAPVDQDHTKSTFSKMLKKDDGRIDWKQPAEKIERMIRAFNPWPGTWTLLPTESKILRIRIEEAEVREDEYPGGSPGFVWCDTEGNMRINTGAGSLLVQRLTFEGKKPTVAKDFLRGYPGVIGKSLV